MTLALQLAFDSSSLLVLGAATLGVLLIWGFVRFCEAVGNDAENGWRVKRGLAPMTRQQFQQRAAQEQRFISEQLERQRRREQREQSAREEQERLERAAQRKIDAAKWGRG